MFCVTKVANSAIKVAFLEAMGNPTDKEHRKDGFEYAGKEEIAKLDGWFTFAVIRNPYDRAVSLWADKCRNKEYPRFKRAGYGAFENFTDFVHALCEREDFDIHWVSMYDTLVLDGEIVPSWLIRYENLDSGWRFVQKKCWENVTLWCFGGILIIKKHFRIPGF